MGYYIELEDLAANAFIESFKIGEKNFISYKVLEGYGAKVIKILHEKGANATLELCRKRTNSMLNNYSNFFREEKQNDTAGLILNDDVSRDDLISKFRGYLEWDLLLALVDKRAISILGITEPKSTTDCVLPFVNNTTYTSTPKELKEKGKNKEMSKKKISIYKK